MLEYGDLLTCCACDVWASLVAKSEAATFEELCCQARSIWWSQTPIAGWLEAFAAHPELGDVASLKQKYCSPAFAQRSADEQANLQTAAQSVLEELATLNASYKAKFGHVFLLKAKGKSASEVLAAMRARMANSPLTELRTAAVEQMKITDERMKLLYYNECRDGSRASHDTGQSKQPAGGDGRSPITSHVLDTASGRPAKGLPVQLYRMPEGCSMADDVWECISSSRTNSDGRVVDFMQPGILDSGVYRVKFDVSAYQIDAGAQYAFYPQAAVDFCVTADTQTEHFHIPLLISPFSYSTYRGS